ncbi:glycosyltransferase family 4 protein [Ectobacillus antri]|uniref:Glycosyltransferase family 4 protein n=1 Tax=Ectobacillus antri TaxID=2486280 RepID=A0ABT6H3W2_9BACI|nr:glycosyltransferase family 4 protein [Ectobacillus antri]MDG4655524.1 glycosyltransferase family 4 protein [Ectobacillus antri]MDG5753282.1 glycosyltransferase family 4 protein [Ectobacillus antri]
MERKRVLILSWEYPPMLIGGLGRHVHELSKALANAGHIIHIITTYVEGSQLYEEVEAVHVHRVCRKGSREHFYHWISELNEAILQYALCLCEEVAFDLVHAHDWLVGEAAKQLQKSKGLPLITTIHATEHGRNQGIHTPLQWEIHMKEKELVKESQAVIVCSEYMKKEVLRILNPSLQNIFVFPNGINEAFFCNAKPLATVYRTYDLQNRTIVFAIGRIVNEKGFYTIIEAAPELIRFDSTLIFIIAGKGPMLEFYKHVVAERGLGQFIHFVGHVSEEEQRAFLQSCHIVVVPSLYEPFGIVALEGMLANKPTIVSDVGGLSEVVQHGHNGYKMEPGSAHSLTMRIKEIINAPEIACQIAQNGYNLVKKQYSWSKIAMDTVRVYEDSVYQKGR